MASRPEPQEKGLYNCGPIGKENIEKIYEPIDEN